jgi:chromosome segregation ATPase
VNYYSAMEEIKEDLIYSFQNKINSLIELLEQSKEQTNKLLKDKQELSEQLKLKSRAFEELEKKYETLKMAKVLTVSDDERQDARMKVNRIVREIDKCIALLNK